MDFRKGVREALAIADAVWQAYVADLSDEELLVRPAPNANHLAWQIGHLISSEHMMMERISSGCMPPLPPGFSENHSRDRAGSDDSTGFLGKDDYVKLAVEQRAGTLALLDKLDDADFDKPVPEGMPPIIPSIGALFSMQGIHWTMHSGQWATLRRQLDKPVVI